MDLMLDTNIVLDHIGRREPFYELSRRTCLLGIVGEARTFVSASMVTDLFYLLRKDFGSREAQRMIEEDLSFLQVVGGLARRCGSGLGSEVERFRGLPRRPMRQKGGGRLHRHTQCEGFRALLREGHYAAAAFRRAGRPRRRLSGDSLDGIAPCKGLETCGKCAAVGCSGTGAAASYTMGGDRYLIY